MIVKIRCLIVLRESDTGDIITMLYWALFLHYRKGVQNGEKLKGKRDRKGSLAKKGW